MNISQSIERLQAYLSNPTEPERKAITALAAREEKRLIKDILTRLERLKAEGREQALFYDAGLEIERAFRTKEITEEEYKNNPLKKAFEEHAQAIPFRANELSMPCLMRATVTAPDYTSAVDKAIRRAEKLIKDIQKAADSNAETTAFIVKELISYICTSAYVIYHPQEWEEQYVFLKRNAEELNRLYKQIQGPPTDKANDIYYRQIEELEAAERELYKEQASKTYKEDKAQDITERILGRIFPEQKPAIVERAEALAGYIYLPNSAINQFVKQTLNNPQNVAAMRKGVISIQPNLLTRDISITYSGSDGTIATIELARTKELFKERVRGGAKMYNFFLQKCNEQNGRETTTFFLQELVDSGLYANKDSAYKGIRKITDKMMSMHIEGTQTIYDGGKKKQVRNAKAVIVAQRDISYNSCSISLPPLIRNNAKHITILPAWAYLLSENGFMLLDYIYYLARQNANRIREKHLFNISLEAIRVHLGLPTPDKAGANPGRLIMEPIETAIEGIENRSKGEIMITPTYSNGEYSNIHEFLAGYLQIQLDEAAENYMSKIAKQQEKQFKAAVKRQEQAALKALEKNEREKLNQMKLQTE